MPVHRVTQYAFQQSNEENSHTSAQFSFTNDSHHINYNTDESNENNDKNDSDNDDDHVNDNDHDSSLQSQYLLSQRSISNSGGKQQKNILQKRSKSKSSAASQSVESTSKIAIQALTPVSISEATTTTVTTTTTQASPSTTSTVSQNSLFLQLFDTSFADHEEATKMLQQIAASSNSFFIIKRSNHNGKIRYIHFACPLSGSPPRHKGKTSRNHQEDDGSEEDDDYNTDSDNDSSSNDEDNMVVNKSIENNDDYDEDEKGNDKIKKKKSSKSATTPSLRCNCPCRINLNWNPNERVWTFSQQSFHEKHNHPLSALQSYIERYRLDHRSQLIHNDAKAYFITGLYPKEALVQLKAKYGDHPSITLPKLTVIKRQLSRAGLIGVGFTRKQHKEKKKNEKDSKSLQELRESIANIFEYNNGAVNKETVEQILQLLNSFEPSTFSLLPSPSRSDVHSKIPTDSIQPLDPLMTPSSSSSALNTTHQLTSNLIDENTENTNSQNVSKTILTQQSVLSNIGEEPSVDLSNNNNNNIDPTIQTESKQTQPNLELIFCLDKPIQVIGKLPRRAFPLPFISSAQLEAASNPPEKAHRPPHRQSYKRRRLSDDLSLSSDSDDSSDTESFDIDRSTYQQYVVSDQHPFNNNNNHHNNMRIHAPNIDIFPQQTVCPDTFADNDNDLYGFSYSIDNSCPTAKTEEDKQKQLDAQEQLSQYQQEKPTQHMSQPQQQSQLQQQPIIQNISAQSQINNFLFQSNNRIQTFNPAQLNQTYICNDTK